MGDVVTDATVKALQEVTNIKGKFVQFVTENFVKIVENVFFFLVLSLTEQCYLYFDQFDSGEMEAGKDAAPSSSRPPSGKPSSRPTSAKPGIHLSN